MNQKSLTDTIATWMLQAVQEIGAQSFVEITASHPREGKIVFTVATMGGEPAGERAARYERLILSFITPRPYAEWSEKIGACLWWNFSESGTLLEPPIVGTPLDPEWPGYHNYWTPLPEATLDRRKKAQNVGSGMPQRERRS